ncbi:hypothetical protein SLE2022_212770 [Rubroshorea leprosula]
MQRINNNGSSGAAAAAAAAGVGHSACASCKHQRKKCDQNCVLAQYFPASKNEEFQAVHKIFGVANVTRMIKSGREEDRKRIADSLIWEAICRQRDPVLGSYGEYVKVFNEHKDLKFKFQVQNQALQQVHQGTEQVPWNNGTNGINRGLLAINNTVCSYYNSHGNGNSMYDRSSRLINYSQNLDELKEERDMVSVLVAVQQQQQQQQHQIQQHSNGVFDPHYCLPG